ncbi:hypothetical protein COY05_02840 [Candidatus Peregrinibacteria bacterium CG_4_10_14_0_2_um_filter_38_24]|nr:MAG: hypothetical protein COY05_02840 [Candidatus Peregrinibacteria bacterium CG_4_10_14_0_2_um_filter_38_24]
MGTSLEKLGQILPENQLCIFESDESFSGDALWKYWSEFVKHYVREGKSLVTISNVRDTLKFVILRLKIMTVEACNNPNILREALYEEKEKRNWSPSTLNTYRKNLNTYFKWLEDMEYIQENKIMKVRKCKEIMNEQRTLTEDQVKLIRMQIVNRRQTRLERWRNDLFVAFLAFTGARPCELLSIQCIDIKKVEKGGYKLVIKGKKQKGRLRYYTLPSWIRDSYEMYLLKRQELKREEPNLFVSSSKRTGWTDKGMRGLFKRLSNEIGFNVNAYAFRRYVATKLNSEGKNLEDIANYLGHTRISTTKRYIERSCALTNECAEVMGMVD